jgi:hypothetical protein
MDSRLKKSLSAGGRENRASHDSVREAPEDTFVSSKSVVRCGKMNGHKAHYPTSLV